MVGNEPVVVVKSWAVYGKHSLTTLNLRNFTYIQPPTAANRPGEKSFLKRDDEHGASFVLGTSTESVLVS